MAIIQIAEGQQIMANPTDTLVYPGVNSCITITTVLPQVTRLGGHAVLIPAPGQHSLQDICNFINTRKNASAIFIIGDIGTWNNSWHLVPQCQNLSVNGQPIHNVAGIATALGYTPANTILLDIADWGVGTYNVNFGFENNHRSLWALDANGNRHLVPNHPAW